MLYIIVVIETNCIVRREKYSDLADLLSSPLLTKIRSELKLEKKTFLVKMKAIDKSLVG